MFSFFGWLIMSVNQSACFLKQLKLTAVMVMVWQQFQNNNGRNCGYKCLAAKLFYNSTCSIHMICEVFKGSLIWLWLCCRSYAIGTAVWGADSSTRDQYECLIWYTKIPIHVCFSYILNYCNITEQEGISSMIRLQDVLWSISSQFHKVWLASLDAGHDGWTDQEADQK